MDKEQLAIQRFRDAAQMAERAKMDKDDDL
jgi:hypothetical protein